MLSLPVELRCEVSVSDAELTLSYELINRGERELGVLNRLWSHAVDGSQELGPDNVFVDLEGDTLHIIKGVLPVPADVFACFGPLPPFASRLSAGGSVEERIVVPLPATVRTLYRRIRFKGRVSTSRKATAHKVAFSVGLVQIGADCRLVADRPPYEERLILDYTGAAADRQVMVKTTNALLSPIDVLDYESFPW